MRSSTRETEEWTKNIPNSLYLFIFDRAVVTRELLLVSDKNNCYGRSE